MNATQSLFILFVLMMAGAVVAIAWVYLGRKSAGVLAIGLSTWFAAVAALSRFGVLVRSDSFPPGPLFILAPVAAYLVAVMLALSSPSGGRIADAIPLSLLVGAQSFRIFVELFIHRLYVEGVVPKILTYSGANVDIYIGASALLVALIAGRGLRALAMVLVWNLVGLLALANVVIRAILTAPGPFNRIHVDPPNHLFGVFPFMFIPAFFVPLAVTLHLLAIRAAWTGCKTDRS